MISQGLKTNVLNRLDRPRSGIRRTSAGIIDHQASKFLRPKTASATERNRDSPTMHSQRITESSENHEDQIYPIRDLNSASEPKRIPVHPSTIRQVSNPHETLHPPSRSCASTACARVYYNQLRQDLQELMSEEEKRQLHPDVDEEETLESVLQRHAYSRDPATFLESIHGLEQAFVATLISRMERCVPEPTTPTTEAPEGNHNDRESVLSQCYRPFMTLITRAKNLQHNAENFRQAKEEAQEALGIKQREIQHLSEQIVLYKDTLLTHIRDSPYHNSSSASSLNKTNHNTNSREDERLILAQELVQTQEAQQVSSVLNEQLVLAHAQEMQQWKETHAQEITDVVEKTLGEQRLVQAQLVQERNDGQIRYEALAKQLQVLTQAQAQLLQDRANEQQQQAQTQSQLEAKTRDDRRVLELLLEKRRVEIRDQAKTITRLTKEVEGHVQTHASSQWMLDTQQERVDQLQAQVQTWSAKCHALERAQHQAKFEATQEREAYHRTAHEAQLKIQALTLELQKHSTQQTQQTQQAQVEQEEVQAQLRESKQSLKSLQDELEAANLCLGERRRQREQELQEHEQSQIQWQAQLSTCEEKLESANAKLEKVEEEKTRARAQVKDMKEQLNRFQQQITSMTEQHADKANEFKVQEMKEHEQSQIQWQAQLSTCEEKLVCANAKLEKVEEEKTRARAQVKDMKAQLNRFQQQITSMTDQHADKANEFKVQLQSFSGLATELDALAHQLEIVEEEKHNLQQQLVTLQESSPPLSSSTATTTATVNRLMNAKKKQMLVEKKQFQKDQQRLANEQRQLKQGQVKFEHEKASLMKKQEALEQERKTLKQVLELVYERLCTEFKFFMKDSSSSVSNDDDDGQKQLCQKQQQWTKMHETLDELDWELIHMKTQLKDMMRNEGLEVKEDEARSSRAPGLRKRTMSTLPFSDAIASGETTQHVFHRMNEDAHAESKVDLDHEKAQAELRAHYERKLSDCISEIRKMRSQQTEKDSAQFQQLEKERKASQYALRQLQLEQQQTLDRLVSTQAQFVQFQDEELEILNQCQAPTTGPIERQQLLETLLALRQRASADDVRKRQELEARRLAKLDQSCGASSVKVS